MEAPHKLNWTPGGYGKGFATNDGALHTWNTTGDHLDGYPTHRDYIRKELGYDPYGSDFRTNQDGGHFMIYPDGGVYKLNREGDDALWNHVVGIDPRLRNGHYDPHLDAFQFTADMQAQDRALNGGGAHPPKVIEHAEPGQNAPSPDYMRRRPFVYNEHQNTVYLGGPGEFHQDVSNRHGFGDAWGRNAAPGNHEGTIFQGAEGVPDGVSFYRDDAQRAFPHVVRTLQDHTGVTRPPTVSQPGTDAFDFTAASDDDLDWLLGPPSAPKPESEWDRSRREWAEQRAREREEALKDPIGYERQQWGREGDVGSHPDIQWVPTHALRPFVEYDRRPGREHGGDPDRYEALGEHIRQHGFKNPVVIEYNPDTGNAHMGEGNHRTWIAVENGIPAMPVRVYRSRRQSPTQVPVNLSPEPSWRDHRGEVRVPDSLKPEHIGLPVVDPPVFPHTAGAWADRHWGEHGEESEEEWERRLDQGLRDGILNTTPEQIHDAVASGWVPGAVGKGYTLPSGHRVEWAVNEYGAPHHQQVQQALGHPVAAQEHHVDEFGNRISTDDFLQQQPGADAFDFDFA